MVSPASTGSSGFFDLIRQSIAFCMVRKKAVFVGAVVFASVITVAQVFLFSSMQSHVGGIADRMGMDMNKIMELQQRADRGDQEAMQKMMEEMGDAMEGFVGADGMMQRDILFSLLPDIGNIVGSVGWVSIVLSLLGVIAGMYYLIVAVSTSDDLNAVLNSVARNILPLLGVTLWAGVRSFVWIPFVGPLIALFLMPRLVFAQYIYLKEHTGVFESVSRSWNGTRGQWLRIVGYLLGAGLLGFVALLVVTMVVGVVLSPFGALLLWVNNVIGQLVAAAIAVFIVLLAPRVLERYAR
jgi:hypothetical protein